MDFLLRILTLLLFAGWKTYWDITAPKADKEKPKTKVQLPFFHKQRIGIYLFLWCIGFMLLLPLLGFKILPMEQNSALQIVGFILVVIGISTAIIARIQLGTNWANAYDYQIKHKQELVTKGIYGYIRHPIYTGLGFALIGAELVASSYLFIFFILLFASAAKQAKKEEILLEKHFGKAYTDYKKRTKMLLPFIL